MSTTSQDHELLSEYSARRSEEAFAELVRRHIDFVYSTAQRIVRDPSLAEDVTQQVFLTLAANASRISRHPVLCGWFHRTTRNIAANLLRSDVRRRQREQEAAQMHSNIEPDTTWSAVEPQLDDALGHLSDPDRELVLLRFFQGRTTREIAGHFIISEEAAQKRIQRAIERLRQILAGRGVTIASQTLAASIAAHSAAAAPAGLAASISSALPLGTMQTAALLGSSETVSMTLAQKAIFAASIAAAVGVGFWAIHQSSARRDQLQLLEQRVATVAAQVDQARAEHDGVSNQLRVAQAEEQKLRELASSAPQLRQQISQRKAADPASPPDEPADPAVKAWHERVQLLKSLPSVLPDHAIPELALLQEDDWIEVARKSLEWEQSDQNGQIQWHLLSSQPVSLMTRHENKLSDREKTRLCFQELRARAKLKFGNGLARAMHAYAAVNEGRIPTEILELRPYFPTPPDEEVLARYEVLREGLLLQQPAGQVVVAEKAFADPLFDTRLVFEGKDAIRLQEMIEIEALAEQAAR